MQQQRTGRPTQTPNSLSASLSLSPSLSPSSSPSACVWQFATNRCDMNATANQANDPRASHTHTHTVPRPLGSRSARLMRFCRALLTCCRGARWKELREGDGEGKGQSQQQQSFIGASLSRSSSSSTLSTRRLTTGERCSEGVRPLRLLTPLAATCPSPCPYCCCCSWSQLLTRLLARYTERNWQGNERSSMQWRLELIKFCVAYFAEAQKSAPLKIIF